MVIKEENLAVDILKDNHVSWEGLKESRRFYVKKTISYGKWTGHKDPENIPAVSWEGGTSAVCKVWFERTNTIREGFNTRTEVEKKYIHYSSTGVIPQNVSIQGSDGTGYSIKFPKRDDASSDLQIQFHYFFDVSNDGYTYNNLYAGKYIYIMPTYIQTKRDKYVTKIDNAKITVTNIPAVGGNVNKGTLTYTKTYNTGETEQGSETVTFTTVSATTKGTTESGVTDVKTIAAGGTVEKTTTIDGITLTHPAFTVKQDANEKSVKTSEYKTTESVILLVSPTVVYSSGGTVTFSLSRKYTLHKAVYQYSSGSTSGGGTDTGLGPETVNANLTYTISGISGTTSITSTTYKIPSTTSARTITFLTTYDKVLSNKATVSLKLDGPDESKAFYYTDLKITTYSYAKGGSGYHFPASGGTITATNCTLEGTYIWHYTSMEGKTASETVNWSFNNLTASMYKFSDSSVTAESLGTKTAPADNSYKTLTVNIKDLKHTYNSKQYDVKDNNKVALTAQKSTTLTRLGNSGTKASTETSSKLNVSINPTTYNYQGGSATLSATLVKTYKVSWTSGSTSNQDDSTVVTTSTTFTGSYTVGSNTTIHSITVSNAKVTIPNLGTSKDNRKYTFTGKYSSLTGTATLTQTGNTTLYTVKFHKNNNYAKWYRNGSAIDDDPVDAQFSESTPYTDLAPDETPTWIEGSNYKYTFTGTYSITSDGNAVSKSDTLSGNLSLYALWSTPTTGSIKVTWNAGDGTFKKVSSNETAKTVYHYYKNQSNNVTIQLTDAGYNNTPVAPASYTFTGWDKAGSMPCLFVLRAATVFNAQYTTTSKTIYWNSNGGSWSDGKTLQSESKNYGSEIKSGYTPTPSKTNTASTSYTFNGWSLTTDGSTVAFPYTITTKEESITFYALYSSSTVLHTVTWTSYPANVKIFTDGSSSKSNKFDHDTVYSKLTAPYTLATLPIYNNSTESNSTIKYSDSTGKWYTTETGTTTLSGNSTKLTSDITVYRHITVEYKVILNCNGGLKASTDTGTSWTFWKTGSFNLGSYTPYRSGYNFKGWGDENTASSGSTSTVNISKSTTYYAVWKQVFTVTWNLQGGTVNSSTSNPTQSVESGGTVSFGTYTPTKSGYTFQGWAETSSATSGSTSGNSSAITSNKTFYAIWKSATLTPILLILAS